jgi:class 3 adenylate cyclase
MAFYEELQEEVSSIFVSRWTSRDGLVVPEPEAVGLDNDCVKFNAVVLYSDLVGSTKMVGSLTAEASAEVYKAFTRCVCRLITNAGGTVTSFDGDRVMGVFIGGSKNTTAAKVGLQINWAVTKVINPAFSLQHPGVNFKVEHATGIDGSPLLVARTGIRGSNDLVWVGKAANQAAKLSEVRDAGYSTMISKAVYDSLHNDAKLHQQTNMWEERLFREETIYRSSYFWRP